MNESNDADDLSLLQPISLSSSPSPSLSPTPLNADRDVLTPPKSNRSPRSARPSFSPNFTPVSKESPRLARIQCTSEKLAKVTAMKEEWAKEKEEKIATMNDRRATLQKFVAESSQKEKEVRKMRISLREDESKRKQLLDRNSFEVSASEKALHVAELERIAMEEKEESLILNKEMMRQFRVKEAELEIAMKEEEAEFLVNRREYSLGIREKENEDSIQKQKELEDDCLRAQETRMYNEMQQEEESQQLLDIFEFRRQLAIHKAEKDKEAKEALRLQMISNGEVVAEGKMVDQQLGLEKQEEHRDIMNFRRNLALDAAQKLANDKALSREEMIKRGEVARDDRKMDQLLGMTRLEEDKDIVNFRRELALAKAAKDKADGLDKRQILVSDGLIIEENRKLDMLLEKARQDEDKDILHYRYETAVAKAAKDKADRDERKQDLALKGEIAQDARKVDEQSARARQEDDRDVINFRRELAMHKTEKDKEIKAQAQLDMKADGAAVREGRAVGQDIEKAKQEEDRDVLRFRQELASHKAEKDKEAKEALRLQMISNGEVVAEGKMVDQQLGLEKQEEHRDIMNFRRNLALDAAQKLANDKALSREEMIKRGEVARDDRKMDQLLGMTRLEEDKDIVNFRRELALAKAAKDKADGLDKRQILVSDGLIIEENRKLDMLLEKARQDEDKDILHYRYETAVAKAAKDKADRDERKQDLALKGEIAQDARKVDEQSARARQEDDRDAVNYRRILSMNSAERSQKDRAVIRVELASRSVAARLNKKKDLAKEEARLKELEDIRRDRYDASMAKLNHDLKLKMTPKKSQGFFF